LEGQPPAQQRITRLLAAMLVDGCPLFGAIHTQLHNVRSSVKATQRQAKLVGQTLCKGGWQAPFNKQKGVPGGNSGSGE